MAWAADKNQSISEISDFLVFYCWNISSCCYSELLSLHFEMLINIISITLFFRTLSIALTLMVDFSIGFILSGILLLLLNWGFKRDERMLENCYTLVYLECRESWKTCHRMWRNRLAIFISKFRWMIG